MKKLFQTLGLTVALFALSQCSHPEKGKTRSGVVEALAAKKDNFQECGTRIKDRTGTGPNGKVVMAWDIDQEGNAENIVVVDNTTENEDLASCIKSTLLQVRFPTSTVVREYKVQFPFVYKN